MYIQCAGQQEKRVISRLFRTVAGRIFSEIVLSGTCLLIKKVLN